MARSEKRTLSIEARLRNYIKGDLNALERSIGRFALVSVRSFQNLKGALFNVKTALAGVGVAFGAIVIGVPSSTGTSTIGVGWTRLPMPMMSSWTGTTSPAALAVLPCRRGTARCRSSSVSPG